MIPSSTVTYQNTHVYNFQIDTCVITTHGIKCKPLFSFSLTNIDKLNILNWGYQNTFQNPVMECVSGGRHMPAIVQKLSARWCWQKQYLLVPEY